jgi:hypothetical protein
LPLFFNSLQDFSTTSVCASGDLTDDFQGKTNLPPASSQQASPPSRSFLLLLGLRCILLSFPKPYDKTADSVHPQDTPGVKANLTPRELMTIPKVPRAPTDPTRTSAEGNDPTPKWKKRLEIAAFFVILIYTIFTALMYCANKKAADAAASAAGTAEQALQDARKNFLVEQRPIIWLTNDIGEPRIFVNPTDPSSGQILWAWHFTNYGKTPVQGLRFRQYMKLGDGPFDLSHGEEGDDAGAPTPPGKVDFDSVISDQLKRTDMERFINSG